MYWFFTWQSGWSGMKWFWFKWTSVTLAISPCPVAAAAYLHSAQLQIHSTRRRFRRDLLPSWEWQSVEVWIWSISPVDGILTTPRHPLPVASSNTSVTLNFSPLMTIRSWVTVTIDDLVHLAHVSFVKVWFTNYDVCSNIALESGLNLW